MRVFVCSIFTKALYLHANYIRIISDRVASDASATYIEEIPKWIECVARRLAAGDNKEPSAQRSYQTDCGSVYTRASARRRQPADEKCHNHKYGASQNGARGVRALVTN